MPVSAYLLKLRQALDLETKVLMARRRIEEWYRRWHGMVHVQYSGGKDSAVLLHLVRALYPDVPAVFCNTGLEFPEIVKFVRGTGNVVWLRPKMTFRGVIEKYGWPVISKSQACAISRYRNTKDAVQKHRRLHGWPNGTTGMIRKKYQYLLAAPFKISDHCCYVMKKAPSDRYAKQVGTKPYIGTMASDSKTRKDTYQKHGCNAFDLNMPKSMPLSIWTEDDIWAYIHANDVPHCSIYDMGYRRTGCVFCAFGAHMEKEPNRFQRLKQTHPKLWTYCMDKLGLREVLKFIGVPCDLREEQLCLFNARVGGHEFL